MQEVDKLVDPTKVYKLDEAVAVLKVFPLPLPVPASTPSFPTLFGVVQVPLMGIAVADSACCGCSAGC